MENNLGIFGNFVCMCLYNMSEIKNTREQIHRKLLCSYNRQNISFHISGTKLPPVIVTLKTLKALKTNKWRNLFSEPELMQSWRDWTVSTAVQPWTRIRQNQSHTFLKGSSTSLQPSPELQYNPLWLWQCTQRSFQFLASRLAHTAPAFSRDKVLHFFLWSGHKPLPGYLQDSFNLLRSISRQSVKVQDTHCYIIYIILILYICILRNISVQIVIVQINIYKYNTGKYGCITTLSSWSWLCVTWDGFSL